jgi:hypothetical protein
MLSAGIQDWIPAFAGMTKAPETFSRLLGEGIVAES